MLDTNFNKNNVIKAQIKGKSYKNKHRIFLEQSIVNFFLYKYECFLLVNCSLCANDEIDINLILFQGDAQFSAIITLHKFNSNSRTKCKGI